jgi:hypothetical protein
VPGLGVDQRAAGTIPSNSPRACRTEPARDGAGLQVPAASAAPYRREGVDIDESTLADWVGSAVVAVDPVLSAERIHADDTTVPVLAKLKTVTGRIWTYVRDDRPFGGKDPPAAITASGAVASGSPVSCTRKSVDMLTRPTGARITWQKLPKLS